jgi:hypothetical protein
MELLFFFLLIISSYNFEQILWKRKIFLLNYDRLMSIDALEVRNKIYNQTVYEIAKIKEVLFGINILLISSFFCSYTIDRL